MLLANHRKNLGSLVAIAMMFLVMGTLFPRFVHPASSSGQNWADGIHGLLLGLSIGINIGALLLAGRKCHVSRSPGLLLCLGLLTHSTSAAPNPAPNETHSGFFTTSDGVRVHYLEAGQGTPIVFVPGWSMPAWIWEKQIAHFAERYHVVALDPRDQGESDKVAFGNSTLRRSRDIQELLTHLKLSPTVLVGWSLAVPELLSYAEQFGGSNVRAYVLVDGMAWDKPNPQFVTAMLGMYQQVQNDRANFTDKFVRSMYHKPQSEEYIKRVEEASLQMPSDSAVAVSVSAVGRADWSPAIRKLDRPVLIMCETALKAMTADPITSLVPATQVELFPDAGHALFVDDPDHFNSVLENFLQKLPAPEKKGI
jgi:microsomal epoxide hydrolase